MQRASWINALIVGLKFLLGLCIVALGVYLSYRRRNALEHAPRSARKD